MDSRDDRTHSFIVRIWLERKGDGRQQAVWRGHVTHVPSGERVYIDHLDGITAFILPYLTEMGVHPGPRLRFRLWLHHRWRRLTRQWAKG